MTAIQCAMTERMRNVMEGKGNEETTRWGEVEV